MEKEKLEQHRIAALDLYKTITNKFQIKPSKTLTSQHVNILNNEFKMAVVGKVKAGKSTFINAILGEPLMPSDIREATCAIVEIFKSDTKYVYAKFLDGQEYKVEDDLSTPNVDEAYEFLKKVAAVQEKYRGLPIAQLNNLLVRHFDEKMREAVFSDELIDEWIKEEKPENIHHLPEDEFNRKINEYLEEHKTGCHIPLTIKVGYPHNFKFDQFRIIDTPGIGTTSGLGEKTKAYIEKHADAVIYLHKESPTEESLQNAWNNVISERAKKNTFLVLTHRGGNTAANSDALFEETKKTFPQISANRIFTVDSLTELAIAQFYGKEFEAIEEICDASEAFEHVCAKALRKSKGNVAELLDILEQQSNMNGLKKELQSFSEKALSIQLHDFIVELCSHLEAEERDRTSDLTSYQSKFRDPQIFATEIKNQKDEIEKLKAEIYEKSSIIREELSIGSKNAKSIEFVKIFKGFEAEINGKEFESSDTKSSIKSYVEKIYLDLENDIEKFVERLKAEVIQQINSQTSTLDGEYSITIPKVVLSEIWQEATIKATSTKTVEDLRRGFWGTIRDWFGKQTKNVEHFDIKLFYQSVMSEIINRLTAIQEEISKNVDSTIAKATKQYVNMMNKKLEDRKHFLEVRLREKLSNDQLEKKITKISNLLAQIKNEMQTCEVLKGELSC